MKERIVRGHVNGQVIWRRSGRVAVTPTLPSWASRQPMFFAVEPSVEMFVVRSGSR